MCSTRYLLRLYLLWLYLLWLYLLWLYLLWMYLLWRPRGQYVLEQVDSVELEQLALLFSRLDTDHDGVLMFGEFLPLHLPRISLVSPSCLPLISFVSPSYLPRICL